MAKTGAEYLKSSSKRSVDVLGSAVVGAALLPAAAVAYGAAAIDNRTLAPIFRHERIGYEGRVFTLAKFRTLRPSLVTEGWRGEGAYDSRASGLGLMLRRYGLDEIPQLQSVLEGEMSLVGLRAASKDSLNYLEDIAPEIFDEWHEAYSAGRPGLIGPGQIYRHRFKNPAPEDYIASLKMDIDYVARASLINDLRILGSAPLKLLAANIRPVPGSSSLETEEIHSMPALSEPAI